MTIFHFFHKDEVTLHLEVGSLTYAKEKDQLLEQGFERIGDAVKAENSQSAHEKLKEFLDDELSNGVHVGGANNFLRFVTGIDPKKKSK